jgi:VCBS repeat-containing protein
MPHFVPGDDFDSLAVGETATVTVRYSMSDDEGAGSSATTTLTVTGTNDAVVIDNATSLEFSTLEDCDLMPHKDHYH